MSMQATSAVGPALLPVQFTPFIGRQDELAEIQQRLADPDCRLLTLLGPGGTGKTRLALQIATLLKSHYPDGVFFVNLQPGESIDYLIPAIANALQLALSGQEDPWQQVKTFLTSKKLLLVLDNFEQLIDGAGLVADLLQETSQLKLLITSREALNLLGEYLYPIGGMTYPTSASDEVFEQYSAVALFTACARRIRPDFNLQDERESVWRICRLVEGLPLALELAATWLRLMNSSQIAVEIESNIHFLATNLRNLPERHRSMRAVFENSWKMLSPEEQRVFQRLSVFRGGFGREPAELVSGAKLAILSALADKSLVRVDEDRTQTGSGQGERYSIHELLRQNAEERLAKSPDEVEEIRSRHCRYFADRMDRLMERYRKGDQEQVLDDVRAEFENVRSAWLWAVQHEWIEEICKTTSMLEWFYQTQSRYLEGQTAFELAAAKLEALPSDPDVDYVLSQVLSALAWFDIRLGRLGEAKSRAAKSNQLYSKYLSSPPPGIGSEPLIILSILDQIQGDYEKAVELASQSRMLSIQRQDPHNESIADYILAGAFQAQGKHDLARQYAQEAYQVAKENNQSWFMAYCLIEWGNAARALGNYAEARQLYEASYTIRDSFRDPEGMAIALNHLGRVAVLQQDYPSARKLFQQSLDIYQRISDRGGLAATLNGLALVAMGSREYSQARRLVWEALKIANEIQFVPQILFIFTSAAELFILTDQPRSGSELLSFTSWHPKTDYETRQRIDMLLSRYVKNLPHIQPEGAIQSSSEYGLNQVVESVLKELSVPSPPSDPLSAGQDGSAEDKNELAEPLSEREVEVLACIASGLTNQQIGEKLYLSLGTVKWYTSQIYGKLGVRNRAQAIARGRDLQLLA